MQTSRDLDKFYTSDKAASTFINFVKQHINLQEFDNIIEPSAGNGRLLKYMPANTIALDLAPEADGIVQQDFFTYVYPSGRNVTIGNPPFGRSNKLSIAFFKHAAKSCDTIAFIIPVTWEKYSIHKQLPLDWQLIANERLPENSFTLDDKPYNVRCTMQIWKRGTEGLRVIDKPATTHPDFEFVSKTDDWDFCMSSSPCIVRSKEYFKEKNGAFCTIFIKANVADLEDVFNRISWQSKEGKAILGGSRYPVADLESIVKIYDMYKNGLIPSKKIDYMLIKERAKTRKTHSNVRSRVTQSTTKPDLSFLGI
ncbi:hypothetical protein OS347_000732 [Vibrio vulnificus]|nr:hypothetical protein [Vibrio vulnificus]